MGSHCGREGGGERERDPGTFDFGCKAIAIAGVNFKNGVQSILK